MGPLGEEGKKIMPTYRIRRADREDQMIEAHSMKDNGTSYVFYDDDNYVITVVPKDAVLSVVEEEAAGG